MTKTLKVKEHIRRAPVDPYAAIKAMRTRQLVLEVMEMELCRIVDEAINAHRT